MSDRSSRSATRSSRRSRDIRSSRSTRAQDAPADPEARARPPRRVPVHPRAVPVDVPGPALDDAPVRRLRHGRGDQRALPLPARPRPDGAVGRLRHADPDGLRLRPRPQPRRGGPRGRRRRQPRRHGAALRRDPARRRQHLDDDQRAGRDPARLLRPGRRAAGRPAGEARRHDPDRHPQGVHRPEGVVLPDRAGDAPGHRHDRVVRAADARAGTRSRSPATTSARPARPPSRSWPSR